MTGKRTHFLKGIRVILACIFILGITVMLCDYTGITHRFLFWMAQVQFFPALLGIIGAFSGTLLLIVLVILGITWLFGRVYCSTICPLGVMQDVFTWLGNRKWLRKFSKRLGKNRWKYQKGHPQLRAAILVVFLLLLFTLHAYASIIEPYSAYARMVSAFFAPVYAWITGNVWVKSVAVLVTSLVLFIGIGAWAFMRGRAWCNNVCPIGTLLSVPAKHSLFHPTIDVDKCTNCRACERNCKAQCIDIEHHSVNLSRCVTCFDCLENCKVGAMGFSRSEKVLKGSERLREVQCSRVQVDFSRRSFLSALGIMAATGVAEAAHKTTDGGLAVIEEKKIPVRHTQIEPAGSQSLRHFAQHCTGCQLCVTVCPEHVLRPSTDLKRLMQPEMQFDKGYCLTGCTRCSTVCPTNAIRPISKEEKTTFQIGHAVWIAENCVVETDGVSCGNCARHCPTGAIIMVENSVGLKIPAIDTERCIGCGHCEYVCPSRPFSAIYVEGHEKQRRI